MVEETERADGVHGLGAWALAVVMGAILANSDRRGHRKPDVLQARSRSQASAAEPLLSYELDRLFRAGRRAPNVDLSAERAEAGRILLTTSSHSGLTTDDRTYLIQQVGALTGLSPADSERRVDNVLASAKTAIARSRRSSIIVAFSIATAVLLGAVAAWAAACAGGTAPGWCTLARLDGAVECDQSAPESAAVRQDLKRRRRWNVTSGVVLSLPDGGNPVAKKGPPNPGGSSLVWRLADIGNLQNVRLAPQAADQRRPLG